MRTTFLSFVAALTLCVSLLLFPNNAHAGGAVAVTPSGEFVELEPLVLPIIDNNGVSQTLSVIIAVEVPGSSEADKVKEMTPRLKDAYIQDLYGTLHRHAAYKGGMLQIGKIKKRLNAITGKVMGDTKINGVLLQMVQERPI